MIPNARRRSSVKPLAFCFDGLAIVLCSVFFSLLPSRLVVKRSMAVDVVAVFVAILGGLFCSVFFNVTAIDTGTLGISTELLSVLVSAREDKHSPATDSAATVVALDKLDSAAISLHLPLNGLLFSSPPAFLFFFFFFLFESMVDSF